MYCSVIFFLILIFYFSDGEGVSMDDALLMVENIKGSRVVWSSLLHLLKATGYRLY